MKKLCGDLSGEFGKTRNDTVRFIVREWMEKNTYLPVHELDEDGDVEGCLSRMSAQTLETREFDWTASTPQRAADI